MAIGRQSLNRSILNRHRAGTRALFAFKSQKGTAAAPPSPLSRSPRPSDSRTYKVRAPAGLSSTKAQLTATEMTPDPQSARPAEYRRSMPRPERPVLSHRMGGLRWPTCSARRQPTRSGSKHHKALTLTRVSISTTPRTSRSTHRTLRWVSIPSSTRRGQSRPTTSCTRPGPIVRPFRVVKRSSPVQGWLRCVACGAV